MVINCAFYLYTGLYVSRHHQDLTGHNQQNPFQILTDWLATWSRVFLYKLIVPQLVKQIRAFNETRRFITAHTRFPPPVPILSQINQFHVLLTYIFNYFNLIFYRIDSNTRLKTSRNTKIAAKGNTQKTNPPSPPTHRKKSQLQRTSHMHLGHSGKTIRIFTYKPQ